MGSWRKSSYSGGNGGDCVEVGGSGAVLVRDTRDRNGVTLTIPADAWAQFTASIKQLDTRTRSPRAAGAR